MDPISKLQKRLNEWEEVVGDPLSKLYDEDRITSLPSELKTKILSCLDTKDAVKTSVLSTKWRLTWTSLPELFFSDELEFSDYYSDNDVEPAREEFTSSVSRVLMQHDRSCLKSFYLRCCLSHMEELINTWVACLLLFKVQEIYISVPLVRPVRFASDIFFCKTLVKLRLHVRGHVNLPSRVCLPRLKSLKIECAEFSDDNSIINLFYGCPVLEELKLRQCVGNNVHVINILLPSLTSLIIEHLNSYIEEGEKNYKIVLDTPSLTYLSIDDDYVEDYIVKDAGHPNKAYISQCGQIRGESLLNLYKGLSWVQELNLSKSFMQVIHSRGIKLPTFDHMITLDFAKSEYLSRILLPILHKTPRLEMLNFMRMGQIHLTNDVGVQFDGSLSEKAFQVEDPPSCLLSHLKSITMNWWRFGSPGEMELVSYLLMHAKVLEDLTIYIKDPKGDQRKLKDDILMLPRGSNHCRISVT